MNTSYIIKPKLNKTKEIAVGWDYPDIFKSNTKNNSMRNDEDQSPSLFKINIKRG